MMSPLVLVFVLGWLAAFVGGAIAGYAAARLRRPRLAVVDLPVHRARQRRGVAP